MQSMASTRRAGVPPPAPGLLSKNIGSPNTSARHTRTAPVRYRPDTAPAHKSAKRVLRGPCIIDLVGQRKSSVAVPYSPSASLSAYMASAAENLAGIPLGNGGRLLRVDSTHIDIIVPKLVLFDVWLQPRATTKVTTTPTKATITAGTHDCTLEGSHHVQSLKLNERYNLDVLISFTWDEGSATKSPRVFVDGKIAVQVDIPAPFSFMPQPVLKSGGDGAINTVLMALMPAFMERLTTDYGRWAKLQAATTAGVQHATK